jgi:hypothetical protein
MLRCNTTAKGPPMIRISSFVLACGLVAAALLLAMLLPVPTPLS